MEHFILTVMLFLAVITGSKYILYLITSVFYHYRNNKYLRFAKDATNADIGNALKVSVIIPAHNESVGVLDCIKSLIDSSYTNLEIVVVNDGSTDDTDTVVKNYIKIEFSQLKTSKTINYIHNEFNGGKGAALNEGIRQSKGDLIFTLDADTLFEHDAIFNAVCYFYKTNLDAAVGNVKIANSKSLLGIIQQIEYTVGFYFKRTHSVFNSEYIIGGAFGIFRRDVFDRFGYFDPSIKTEDIELSTRLQSKGCSILFIENAIAYTEGPTTVDGLMKQRLRWKKGRLDTFIKHKQLFFSTKKEHNKFLTFYLLPITLFYEIELLFEPLFTLFGLYYLITTRNFFPILIWMMFSGFIYSFAFIFGSKKNSKIAFVFIPTYFFLSYLVTFVEIYAMFTSIKLLAYGQDVVWQTWNRKGVKNI